MSLTQLVGATWSILGVMLSSLVFRQSFMTVTEGF